VYQFDELQPSMEALGLHWPSEAMRKADFDGTRLSYQSCSVVV